MSRTTVTVLRVEVHFPSCGDQERDAFVIAELVKCLTQKSGSLNSDAGLPSTAFIRDEQGPVVPEISATVVESNIPATYPQRAFRASISKIDADEDLSARIAQVLRDHNLVDRETKCGDLTYVIRDLMQQIHVLRSGQPAAKEVASGHVATDAKGVAGTGFPARPGRIDLEAIESRANAASAGPWISEPHHDEIQICQTDEFPEPIIVCAVGMETPFEADVAFIANAREDVPALVSEVRHLREVVADMHFACKAGYGNDAMSKALDELGCEFLVEYGRRNGEIGGDE